MAGRYLVFRARLRDHPGALVDLLAELAELEVNVLDVVHERVAARLNVDEAEVLLHLETRGPEHCDEVLGRLRREGYTLSFS
jgi:threonine dehydratase